MALSFSNISNTGSSSNAAGSALQRKQLGVQPFSQLNLSNLGRPSVPGVTNTKVVPPGLVLPKPPAPKPAKAPLSLGPRVAHAETLPTQPQNPTPTVTTPQAPVPPAPVVPPAPQLTEQPTQPTQKAPKKATGPTQLGLVGSLVDAAKKPGAAVDTAYNRYDTLNKELQNAKISEANTMADLSGDAIPLQFQQGRKQVLQTQYGAITGALSGALQGASTAYGTAVTGQGQQLAALGTAAQQLAPVQIAPGNTLATPGGETLAGGLGGFVNYQTAQQVLGLSSQYPDAVGPDGKPFAYDETKTPQENVANFRTNYLVHSPTYQKSTYGVPGAQTVAGATATQAAQQGYTAAVQTYQNMNTAFTNADGQAGLLLQALKGSGINSSDARFANQTLNNIRRQLSSSDLQVFDSALKATQAAYGNLLVTGGGTTPTESTGAYNVILNPNSSLSAFEAALNQLKREGQTKLNAQGQQVNTYFSQLQAGSPNGGGAPAGGGGGGGGGFAEQW